MKNPVVLSIVFILTLFSIGQAQITAETSSFTVTRSDDRNKICLPSDCSLREAVDAANASPSDDTIAFADGLTKIELDEKEIVIKASGSLTFQGPGADLLTIDGGTGTNRIFYSDRCAVTVTGLTLTGGGGTGSSFSGSGGAIYAYRGPLTIDGVHITDNSAERWGGGIAFDLSNPTHGIIINSTVSRNFAALGGGGVSMYGRFTVVNSTITGNKTRGYGGGILLDLSIIEMRNVTVTDNVALVGGGVYADFVVYLTVGNTIVAGNIATSESSGPEIHFGCDSSCAYFTSLGGNFVGDTPGDSANTGAMGISYMPSDIRDEDPMIGPLQNNGGSITTHALLPRSPAIDRGQNEFAVDPTTGISLIFDQRGIDFPRILNGRGVGRATVDIGAFEFANRGYPR